MNRFIHLKGKKALMPFMMLGDPDLSTSLQLIEAVIETGVEALELGIPFSDPMADGKIIQAASYRALQGGMTFQKAIRAIQHIRTKTALPIAVLTYTNLIFHAGFAANLALLHAAGVDALLLADLPYEEAIAFAEIYRMQQMGQSLLVAQNSDLERSQRIHSQSTAFTYLVNAMGITGQRDEIPAATFERLAVLQEKGGVPIFVGFGIHTPAQAKILWDRGADGVIVGSKLIELIQGENSFEPAKLKLQAYLASFIEGKI